MKMITHNLRKPFVNANTVKKKSPTDKLIFGEPKTMQPKRRKMTIKPLNRRKPAKLPMLQE